MSQNVLAPVVIIVYPIFGIISVAGYHPSITRKVPIFCLVHRQSFRGHIAHLNAYEYLEAAKGKKMYLIHLTNSAMNIWIAERLCKPHDLFSGNRTP